jgi:hypothetical protein
VKRRRFLPPRTCGATAAPTVRLRCSASAAATARRLCT